MIHNLISYIPAEAKNSLADLLTSYTFNLKIVKGRKTKRGDFRATKPLATITINNDLSKEQFLITLIHEIAHLEVSLQYPKAKAHGTEWKQSFKRLMLPFLNNAVFDDAILMPLAKHLINAKATTDSDVLLSTQLQLKNKLLPTNKSFIFELKPGVLFKLNNRTFKIITKRRTRYECLEISTQKRFLIRGNAPVQTLTN